MNEKSMRQLRYLLAKLIKAELHHLAKPTISEEEALVKLDENLALGLECAIAFICGLCDVQVEDQHCNVQMVGPHRKECWLHEQGRSNLWREEIIGSVWQASSLSWYGSAGDTMVGPFLTRAATIRAVMNLHDKKI